MEEPRILQSAACRAALAESLLVERDNVQVRPELAVDSVLAAMRTLTHRDTVLARWPRCRTSAEAEVNEGESMIA